MIVAVEQALELLVFDFKVLCESCITIPMIVAVEQALEHIEKSDGGLILIPMIVAVEQALEPQTL